MVNLVDLGFTYRTGKQSFHTVLCVVCGTEHIRRRNRLWTVCKVCKPGSWKHGHECGDKPTPELKSYRHMKSRCLNKDCPDFVNYGGRGIRVCDRWLSSFDNFYKDMGAKPTPQHTLDRINVNGDYDPTNCRWATKKEQANNKRNNVPTKYTGSKTVYYRGLRKLGCNLVAYMELRGFFDVPR